jgi:glutathione S-transferase
MSAEAEMIVHGDMRSGNCYKVKLLLNHLQLPHRWHHVDILKGEARAPDFVAKNPNAKIPLLELDDGTCLAESNAILHYLAEGTAYLAAERLAHAQTLQWMFFEQYSHEPFIAVARFIVQYLGRPADQEVRLQEKMAPGYKALAVMERHLGAQDFFAGARYSIADIALYAYTHVAHEGGFELTQFPAIGEWLSRVQAQPGYISMQHAAAIA